MLKYLYRSFNSHLILYPILQHLEVLPKSGQKSRDITKFRGDNQRSLEQWILKFEAHLAFLDIEEGGWKQMVLCCTEASAFTALSTALAANEDFT